MLQVSGASKHFEGREIFSGFDFTLPRGRFHVMIGPSGCGKSTLLDGLTGTIRLDEGTLAWKGSILDDLSTHAAYMHQKDMLLPWFSLLDNALLPAKVAGRDKAAAKEQAVSLLRRMGLSGYESHLPARVSGGMRQRCALSRTLMFERDLILLDEPLSALDTITRKKLQSYLLLLQTEFNRTILMITHDVDEALLLADRIYLLSDQPMTVLKEYELTLPKPRRFDNPVLMQIKADLMMRLEGEEVREPV